jgi:hypothetical protein
VQAVPGPQLVGHGREATIGLPGGAAARANVEPVPGEMRLQRSQPRHRSITGAGKHDLPDLRRGPLRPLELEPERRLKNPRRRARRHHTRLGDQRCKPTPAIGSDPLNQRPARHSDQPTTGANVLPSSEQADEPAALGHRQTGIGGLPDQRIPKQPDLTTTALIHPCSSPGALVHERPSSQLTAPPPRRNLVLPSSPPTDNLVTIRHIRPKTESQHPRPRGEPDRLQRIRHPAAGRPQQPELRIQPHRPSRELRTDLLSALSEPARPVTDRVRRHRQPRSDPSIAPRPRPSPRPPPRSPQLRLGAAAARCPATAHACPHTPTPRPQPPITNRRSQHPRPRVPPRPKNPAT